VEDDINCLSAAKAQEIGWNKYETTPTAFYGSKYLRINALRLFSS